MVRSRKAARNSPVHSRHPHHEAGNPLRGLSPEKCPELIVLLAGTYMIGRATETCGCTSASINKKPERLPPTNQPPRSTNYGSYTGAAPLGAYFACLNKVVSGRPEEESTLLEAFCGCSVAPLPPYLTGYEWSRNPSTTRITQRDSLRDIAAGGRSTGAAPSMARVKENSLGVVQVATYLPGTVTLER